MNLRKKNSKKMDYEIGSENVFADLGFDNPEESIAKADLIFKISAIIKKKKYTQIQTAKIIGVDQPRVSQLLKGRLDLFSVDMLIHFLNALGQDVHIVVKAKPRNRKKAQVMVMNSFSDKTSFPIAARSH